MKNRRYSCLLTGLVGFSIVTSLLLLFIGWLFLGMPARAEKIFGPPTSQLNKTELYWLSTRLMLNVDSLTRPLDNQAPEQVFTVQLGEATVSILSRLKQAGLIADVSAFSDYLVYAGLDQSIQAGEYLFNSQQTPIEIASTLQDATPAYVTFHILTGWRMEEIATAIQTSGLSFSSQDFYKSVTLPPTPPILADVIPIGSPLEGFLFPAVYRLPRDLSVDGFLTILLGNFDAQVGHDLRQAIERQGLTLYQAVILASIVQREAVVEEEMPQIASVFYNRLNAGMKLDSDPTIQYALGTATQGNPWWKSPLSLEDLKLDSPFNTYLYPGLPPNPIANPGLSALRAVAYPAQTPYYYFRAACDSSGRHNFAETFEQHLAYECP